MGIPPFDSILNTLPPHTENPAGPDSQSPFACTVRELCERFATSEKRREIFDRAQTVYLCIAELQTSTLRQMDGTEKVTYVLRDANPPRSRSRGQAVKWSQNRHLHPNMPTQPRAWHKWHPKTLP